MYKDRLAECLALPSVHYKFVLFIFALCLLPFVMFYLLVFIICFMLVFFFCMFYFLFNVFHVFVLFCVLFFLMYIIVSFLFVYKCMDHCHRLETQLQLVDIVKYSLRI
jgi:hypothetical protein